MILRWLWNHRSCIPSVLGVSIIMAGAARGFQEWAGCQAEQGQSVFPLPVVCWEHSMCDARPGHLGNAEKVEMLWLGSENVSLRWKEDNYMKRTDSHRQFGVGKSG